MASRAWLKFMSWNEYKQRSREKKYRAQQCKDLDPVSPDRISLSASESKLTPAAACRLLSLPAELRILIWEYALGGHDILLFRTGKSLTHGVLLPPGLEKSGKLLPLSSTTVRNQVLQLNEATGSNFLLHPAPPPKLPLSALLKTCRVIYGEAATFLYSANRFILLQNKTLEDLGTTTPPHRFAAIRHLHIHLQLQEWRAGTNRNRFDPSELDPWNSTSLDHYSRTRFLHMTSLENLSVFLQGPLEQYYTYIKIAIALRRCSKNASGSFACRLPWPAPFFYESSHPMEVESMRSNAELPMTVFRPDNAGTGDEADEDFGNDTGWRVGNTMFPRDDGSGEIDIVGYTVYTPIPK
ncbi:hypothetical protein EJ04DRAFT_511087 [Polyplosphaeria fusca]|uniref:DUF7730 domain-containing protein n=1 Tax=Polyplosphaeria fusca TaxID=682080 RepID=A0A9P4V5I9_9PLEO|nr:hypothetical protein EJ04DRAFT_511087 [Polyplosphaeria fusca]